MRIGILTNTYPPNLNGVSITVHNLSQKLREKGVEVFIATPKVKGVNYSDYILPVRSISAPKSMSPDLKLPYLYSGLVADFFEQNKVDLIHTHDTIFGGIEGAEIAKTMQIPCVHSYHTLIESYQNVDVPGYKQFIRKYTEIACNKHDKIIALSDKTYNYLLEIGVESPIARMLNVPVLSHLKQLPFDKAYAETLGIKPTDFVIITFGRVAKEKGLDIGITALQGLLKTYPNIKYLIAGLGPEIKSLRNLAEELGILNQVIFSGKFTPENLSKIASLAKVFLFTSETENLPTNLLEASYLGLPIVANRDISTNYILTDNINGYKTDFEGLPLRCLELYLQPELLNSMSKKATEAAQNLIDKDITQDYINLYQDLIDNYKPKPNIITKVENFLSNPNEVKTIRKIYSKIKSLVE